MPIICPLCLFSEAPFVAPVRLFGQAEVYRLRAYFLKPDPSSPTTCLSACRPSSSAPASSPCTQGNELPLTKMTTLRCSSSAQSPTCERSSLASKWIASSRYAARTSGPMALSLHLARKQHALEDDESHAQGRCTAIGCPFLSYPSPFIIHTCLFASAPVLAWPCWHSVPTHLYRPVHFCIDGTRPLFSTHTPGCLCTGEGNRWEYRSGHRHNQCHHQWNRRPRGH